MNPVERLAWIIASIEVAQNQTAADLPFVRGQELFVWGIIDAEQYGLIREAYVAATMLWGGPNLPLEVE